MFWDINTFTTFACLILKFALGLADERKLWSINLLTCAGRVILERSARLKHSSICDLDIVFLTHLNFKALTLFKLGLLLYLTELFICAEYARAHIGTLIVLIGLDGTYFRNLVSTRSLLTVSSRLVTLKRISDKFFGFLKLVHCRTSCVLLQR